MLVQQSNSVDDWVALLDEEHMPALAETVQKLNKLTSDDDARVSQLTEQILKDPSLTSRVLQISNSVVYKGFGGNIKTITYAIVMLGFTTVRDISLSMQILDNVLKRNPSQYLMAQIANSFHAAMQARSMLAGAKTPDQEEIFISTLLLHFAELAMLSRDDEISRQLNELLSEEEVSVNDAAREVLGCSFDQISLALARHWELGGILIEALNKVGTPSKSAQAVLLADELSQVAGLGWNAEPVKAVVNKIAKYRNISVSDALDEIKRTADLSQELAVQYGAAKVRHLIPGSDVLAPVNEPELIKPVSNGARDSVQHEPDKVGDVQLQMDIMQRLNALIAERRMDVNAMLGLVMEGMCNAVGMERVVMALVTKDRKQLLPKLFKGQVDDQFKARFNLLLNEENVFTSAIMLSQQFWMGSKLMAGRSYLHTEQIQQAVGYHEYFVVPIIVSRKPIGVFYADRAVSGTGLNEQQYAGFSMLAQQAGMAISANQAG
ncbi:HDOD domain-containing protein [Ketobacter sp. MCCC 1A13808]|uniref:HDOD domain-containing protein n=1 Tax=Ketobacter sp. MCCC 1A13808 TaxID=2602738 RepID=UPI0012EBA7DC|nr:HDOD domain-containing protein [Ketobacter sp. MCCC 1A13808]MVF13029.1 HDOD domain-containing protein [Ketobacter sp. MCCC 1A13808]